MTTKSKIGLSAIALAAIFGAGWAIQGAVFAQAPRLQTPATDITLKSDPSVAEADQQTRAIVDAAQAYLAKLSPEQRAASLFDLADNTQRANWSNFPDGPVQRLGVKRGDMNDDQLQALNALLRTVLSDAGYQNIVYQLAAEDSLGTGNGPAANFGSEFYYASFLGAPSTDAPWMLQFGGHHLAFNVTVARRDLSFSPMLTGGQPLNIDFDDQQVFIPTLVGALATSAGAHPHTYVEQQALLSIGAERVDSNVTIVPSLSEGQAIFDQLDLDGNGDINHDEAQALQRAVLDAAHLTLDGTAAPWSAGPVTMPSAVRLSTGTGQITLSASARLPNAPARDHSLRFEMTYDALSHDWQVQPFYFADLTAHGVPELRRDETAPAITVSYSTGAQTAWSETPDFTD